MNLIKKIVSGFAISTLVLICACQAEKQYATKTEKKAFPVSMTISQMKKQLVGTWNMVKTSTTDETLDNEMKYIFTGEGNQCKKKNLLHGFFEEKEGTFSLKKRGGINYLVINFEDQTQEKFTIFFRDENYLHMTYLSGQYKFKYELEREVGDIFDMM